jgi:hypothetical protein
MDSSRGIQILKNVSLAAASDHPLDHMRRDVDLMHLLLPVVSFIDCPSTIHNRRLAADFRNQKLKD